MRPTALASHGGAHEPGWFWYRENYAVCEACYRAGFAEDQHGHTLDEDVMRAHAIPEEIAEAGHFSPGWRKGDYHRFLGFAGKQSRGAVRMREQAAARIAKGLQEVHAREHGLHLQRAAARQRRQASEADQEVGERNASKAASVKRDGHARSARAEEIRQQRLHHALTSAAEIRGQDL